MLIDDFTLHTRLHLDALHDLAHGVPEGLPGQLGELAPVLSTFEDTRATIEQDQNLTALGRQNKLAEERAKATATIDAWKTGKVTGIDAQAAALDATRRAQAEKGVTTPTEFAIKFMGEKLSPLDPFECEVLYSDATEQERLVIEAAAESLGRVPRRRGPDGALVWEHILSPERIAKAQAARMDRADPSASASLDDLNRIRNAYSSMASAARSLLK
jgi:hypothetical protein